MSEPEVDVPQTEESPYASFGDSKTHVIKIGGENASDFVTNVRLAQERVQAGITPILVVSAMRSNKSELVDLALVAKDQGFNTTSHLIAIADELKRHQLAHQKEDTTTIEASKQKVRALVQVIEDFHTRIVETICSDDETIQALPEGITADNLKTSLNWNISSHFQELRDACEAGLQNSEDSDFSTHGEDRLIRYSQAGDSGLGSVFSFTGFGERLSSTLHQSTYLTLFSGSEPQLYDTTELQNKAYRGRLLESNRKKKSRGRLTDKLKKQFADGIIAHTRRGIKPLIVPGHIPHFALSRGYSDVGAAMVTSALKAVDTAVGLHIWKQASLHTSDLRRIQGTSVVDRLSYVETGELMGMAGARAGAVHADAIPILNEAGVPTYVYNPKDMRAENITTISSERKPRATPKVVAEKPLGTMATITSPNMIDRPGVVAKIMKILRKYNVSDIFTSEGGVAFTLNEKLSEKVKAQLNEEMRRILGEDVSINISEECSTIYIIGDGMNTIKTIVNMAPAFWNCEPIFLETNAGLGVKIIVPTTKSQELTQRIHDILFPKPLEGININTGI